MTTYIDLHIVQSVPPSCINRDDTGAPKSAFYGGTKRLRVSSQAWKRATRLAFDVSDEHLSGVRTLRVVDLIVAEIQRISDSNNEDALALAEAVFKAAGIKVAKPKQKKDAEAENRLQPGYLMFMSYLQIRQLAELAVEQGIEGLTSREGKAAVKKLFKQDNSVDLALFGRMVADVSDLNVDASCQVAHAISTHRVDTEFDYFTAVDDEKSRMADQDAGAGMIGTVEFASATLYRYATINYDMLVENLGDEEVAKKAVRSFIQAFALSMPTGKQNTFANRTRPEFVMVDVRDDQPVSLAGAFEDAVKPNLTGAGYVQPSVDRLLAFQEKSDSAYGTKPKVSCVTSTVDVSDVNAMSFNDLVDTVINELPQTEGE